jgi:nitronate monooxygenase
MAAGFDTGFTTLVGCRVPIQLAVMGGGTGRPELAVAVSQAGGLGMLSSTFPLPVGEQLSWVHARTKEPIGVGFFAFDVANMLEELELAGGQARVVDIFWGPDPAVVERIHDCGALAFWQVGSLDDGLAAGDAAMPSLRGVEAGGHVRGHTALKALLDSVLARIDVPVLGAGGIGDRRSFEEVLEAGAAGARIGTRLVAAVESGAHPAYKKGVVDAGIDSTEIIDSFAVCPLCATVPRRTSVAFMRCETFPRARWAIPSLAVNRSPCPGDTAFPTARLPPVTSMPWPSTPASLSPPSTP